MVPKKTGNYCQILYLIAKKKLFTIQKGRVQSFLYVYPPSR